MDSFADIVGPIIATTTVSLHRTAHMHKAYRSYIRWFAWWCLRLFCGVQFNCKEEHADEVAQFFSDVIHYLRAEIAKNNGYRYGKCVRNGSTFYCWEEYASTYTEIFTK